MIFDFIGDRIGISMKCAFETFFSEYNGYAQGVKYLDK